MMGAPPNWLLWLMVIWYFGKFALFLFAVAAKCWEVTRKSPV